eukprot:sb/3473863/
MAEACCTRCGKAAKLAPCYQREDTQEQYHYQCIMISIQLEKPFALEKSTPFERVKHLLELNEDKDSLQLQHDRYQGMGENLYLQTDRPDTFGKEGSSRSTDAINHPTVMVLHALWADINTRVVLSRPSRICHYSDGRPWSADCWG